MRMHSLLASLVALSAIALTACGGSQPPPKEPSSAGSAAPEAPKADEATDASKTSETSETKPDTAKKDEKPADTSGPEVKRTAKDIITAPEVTFMFNFNESEPKEKAEKDCTASSGNNPKKMALCMKKANSKFHADGMQFKKDDKGEWVWITLRRTGSKITVLHKVHIDFAEDKPDSVLIKTSGKDLGRGGGKVPSEQLIEVPNEFEIAVKDPTYGRMVYEAKIGIMSNDKQ